MNDVEKQVKDEVLMHRNAVMSMLGFLCAEIMYHSRYHDASKLENEEEFSALVRLKELDIKAEYGTEEYENIRNTVLKNMIKHHHKANSHHPEFFYDGISGMTLVNLMEMFVDWCVAGLQRDGRINLDAACEKYDVCPQLASVFKNTVDYYRLEHFFGGV